MKISDNVYKIVANSNIYLLLLEEPILIDAGEKKFQSKVLKEIKLLIDPLLIKKILLTHLHYDHIGNISLFPNAEVFAHKDAIQHLKMNRFESILSDDEFNFELKELPKKILGLDVIHTPGHTAGSVCFFYKDKKILFTGDTLFFGNHIGRTDLPTSVPERIEGSLSEIMAMDYEILCPGHDY